MFTSKLITQLALHWWPWRKIRRPVWHGTRSSARRPICSSRHRLSHASAFGPEIWFAQVEATFTTRRITPQKTTFDCHCFPHPRSGYRDSRSDSQAPPETMPYTVLKEKLIRRTAPSEQRRLRDAEKLGDRKPTQCMQQLLGDRASTTDSTFYAGAVPSMIATKRAYGTCFHSGHN